MAVNGNEKRGPNLAFIDHAMRNSRVARLPGVPSADPNGKLSAMTEREVRAADFRKMGHSSARLMANGRLYTWGEIGTGRGPRKSPSQRAADEAKATKLAKKKAR